MLDETTKNQIESCWADAVEEGLKRNPNYNEYIEYRQKEYRFMQWVASIGIIGTLFFGFISLVYWSNIQDDSLTSAEVRQMMIDKGITEFSE